MSITINDLIDNLDNQKELFNLLIKLNREDTLLSLCTELNKEKKLNYFDLSYEAINQEVHIFSVSRVLEIIAHLSIIDMDIILKLYALLNQKMAGDLAGGTQYSITKTLAINDINFAKEFLEKLLVIDDSYVIFHISTILTVLHNNHNENQFIRVLKMMNSTNINMIKSSLDTIGRIDITQNNIDEVFKAVKFLQKQNNEKIDGNVISCCNSIMKEYPIFKEILLEYSNTIHSETKYQLSHILMLNDKECIDEEWYQKCLFSLVNTPFEHQGIINNINFILNELIKNIANYEMIKDFLLQWSGNSDIYNNMTNSTLQIFISSFQSEQPELLNKFITECLNIENYKIHLMLPHFVSSKTILDTDILQSFSDDEILFVCRKILGYFYKFEEIINLTFSIVTVDKLSERANSILKEVVVNFIGKNYPYDTLEYLKDLDIKGLNTKQLEFSSYIIKVLENKNKLYKELPRLKELQSSSKQNRLISRANNISMKKLMEEKDENSLLSIIAPNKILIKYGKGNINYLNGSYGKPMFLQTISSSVTMPTSSRSHPIYAELERYGFKQARKGE